MNLDWRSRIEPAQNDRAALARKLEIEPRAFRRREHRGLVSFIGSLALNLRTKVRHECIRGCAETIPPAASSQGFLHRTSKLHIAVARWQIERPFCLKHPGA